MPISALGKHRLPSFSSRMGAICLALQLGVFMTLSACQKVQKVQEIFFALDTVIQVTINDQTVAKAAELIDCLETMCKEYENMFSATNEGSEIQRFNQSQRGINVSPEVAMVIERGLYYGQLSEGSFDITIRPETELWDFQSGTEPDIKEMSERLPLVDYRQVKVDGTYVSKEHPGVKLDLGGIAKGYIGDKLREFLMENGVKDGVLNLGGNVCVIGKKKIGIEKPYGEGELLDSVEVEDKAVVTSGVYQRGFWKDGKRYHHILDPDTGYPVDNGVLSVVVVADNSMDADALSTIMLLLGPERGYSLAESMDGISLKYYMEEGR